MHTSRLALLALTKAKELFYCDVGTKEPRLLGLLEPAHALRDLIVAMLCDGDRAAIAGTCRRLRVASRAFPRAPPLPRSHYVGHSYRYFTLANGKLGVAPMRQTARTVSLLPLAQK